MNWKELFSRPDPLPLDRAMRLDASITALRFAQSTPLIPPREWANKANVWKAMQAQISILNSPLMYQNEVAEDYLAKDISLENANSFFYVSVFATAGILLGKRQMEQIYAPDHAEREEFAIALQAVDPIPNMVTRYAQLQRRVQTVFGTIQRQGTLGTSLASRDVPLFFRQQTLIDAFRVYGDGFGKQLST